MKTSALYDELKNENEILEEALNLACEKIVDALDSEQAYPSNERRHFAEMQKQYLIEQAKESICKK